MGLLLNRAKETTATAGTGTVTLGGAVSPYRTWAASGATSGYWYDYLIEDGTAWEMGVGFYNGTTITRPGPGTDPWFESFSGALISLSGSATIACVASKDTLTAGGVYMPPMASAFTSWVNQGAATLTNTKRNGLVLQAPKATGQNLHSPQMALPAAPWTLLARINTEFFGSSQDGGICLSDGTKFRSFAIQSATLNLWSWTAFNSFSAGIFSQTISSFGGFRDIWLQIKDDGTNRTYYYGPGPDQLMLFFTEATNTFLTATKAGLQAEDQANLNIVQVGVMYWFLG